LGGCSAEGSQTQHIGASYFPADTIKKFCGPILEKFRFEVKIPGLLVIDTPGHEAFANLRRRGGSAADIAILVVDVIRGFEVQTYESLSILKARKTPFLVAISKIDSIAGWRPNPGMAFGDSFSKQAAEVQLDLDNRLYSIMGTLSRLGFRSDRYDRVKDFRDTVAMVPTSGKTGEGIPELMALLVGLTQTFMKQELMATSGPGKGVVLEIKEEPGLGVTANVILYDGVIRTSDTIVMSGKEAPILTTVRALLLPKPLDEIRDPRNRFSSVEEVAAVAGVKIVAPNLENALAGSSLSVVPKGANPQPFTKMVMDEVEALRIKTDIDGVILKTDTLGSLEAITALLSASNVAIRIADVGDISRRDVVEAEAVRLHDSTLGVILGFNVRLLPDAEEEANKKGVKVFQSDVIYRLIEDYVRWRDQEKAAGLKGELERLTLPGRIQILPGCIFRRSKPAIVGVEVQSGRIRPGYRLMLEDGRVIGEVQRIQDKGKDIREALAGTQVAISMDEPIVGRHIREGDTLFVAVPEQHVKLLLTKFKEFMNSDEIELLNKLVETMRKLNPFWAF
jgi:translation initiation factor 5B